MALVYIAGYIVRKDTEIDDSHEYYEKYGSFTDNLNRGGLSLPGDSACQWTFFSYIMFKIVTDHVCRKSLSNILVLISEMHMLNMNRSQAFICIGKYIFKIIIATCIHHDLQRRMS